MLMGYAKGEGSFLLHSDSASSGFQWKVNEILFHWLGSWEAENVEKGVPLLQVNY